MIKPLKTIDHSGNKKLEKAANQLTGLINALNEHEIPDSLLEEINSRIDETNLLADKSLKNSISKTYRFIVKRVQKELGLVPKGYYQTLWMIMGMSAFGIPIGMAISFAISGGPQFFGIGFLVGVPMGIAVGINLDKKAKRDGKQLSVKYAN